MFLSLTAIRLATALIPAKRIRRKVRDRLMSAARDRRLRRLVPAVFRRYAAHEAECRAKLERGERLRVAFLVCDASMFSAEPVFLKMRDDARFECFIAVVPRVSRGEAFLRETYAKTIGTLLPRYGEAVRPLYNPATKKCEGLDGRADIVFTSILYEDQAPGGFTVEHISRYALTAVISYGYGGLFKSNVRTTIFLPNIILAWRYMLSNRPTYDEWLRRNPLLGRTAAVCGYAKMDRYARTAQETAASPRTRKRILICPHHSIETDTDGLRLSSFLRFADFFLRLPELRPDVDFIFRPHPLLFPRLRTAKWWGEKRTAEYERKMESFPNVEFQRGGDYFRTFAESDALIHDCGSFLAEYFYTGKPQCYLLADPAVAEREFLPFGKKLLDASYKASNEDGILAFIDGAASGIEPPAAKEARERAAREVCVNHPDAAAAVVRTVVDGIQNGGGHD